MDDPVAEHPMPANSDPMWANSLLRRLNDLRHRGLMCDASVTSLTGQAFQVHSSVLTAASPVLSSAFEGVSFDFPIELPLRVSSDTLDTFLTFIYSGILKYQDSTIAEVEELSRDLEVTLLTDMCETLRTQSPEPVASVQVKDDQSRNEEMPPSAMEVEFVLINGGKGSQIGAILKTEQPAEVDPFVVTTASTIVGSQYTDQTGTCGTVANSIKGEAKPATTQVITLLEKEISPRRSKRGGRKQHSSLAINRGGKTAAKGRAKVKSSKAKEETTERPAEGKPEGAEICTEVATVDEQRGDDVEQIKVTTKRRTLNRSGRAKTVNGGKRGGTKTIKKENREPGEQIKQCTYCGKVFAAMQMLIYHEMKHRGESRFSCEFCGKGYVVKHNYEAHLRKHTGVRPFKCEHCQKDFRDKNSMTVHRKYHCRAANKGTDRPVCDKCQVQFWSKQCLQDHKCPGAPSGVETASTDLETRPRKDYYTCDLCAAELPRYQAYKAHMKNMHTKNFSCQYCSKTFRWEHSLRLHTNQHVGSKTFFCSKCQKAFWTKNELKSHERIHSNERPYPCEYCNKAYKTSSQRNVHHRAHRGEKTHACEICHKTFLGAHKVKRHMLTHSEDYQFRCPACNKAFKRSDNFKKHLATHDRDWGETMLQQIPGSSQGHQQTVVWKQTPNSDSEY